MHRNLIKIIALSLLIASCHDKVDWDFPDYPPKIAVNGLITAGEPITVHVSTAKTIDSTKLQSATNAVVELFRDGEYMETLEHEYDGLYTSSLLAKKGEEYQVQVSVEGSETVTASTALPNPTTIIDVKIIRDAWFNYWGELHNGLEVTFSSNGDHYLEIIAWERDGRRVYHDEEKTNDPVLLNEGLPLLLFSTETISDDTYTMGISIQSEGNTPVIVELRTVSEAYYEYSRQLYLYETGRYPDIVGGTVTAFPLYSNVEGGHGVFAGYSSVVSDTIFPDGISNIEQGTERHPAKKHAGQVSDKKHRNKICELAEGNVECRREENGGYRMSK